MKTTSTTARSFWRGLLGFCIWITLASLVALVVYGAYALRDRNPGYELAVSIHAKPARDLPYPLHVGFGRVKINPDLSDPGRPVWLAGFSQNRAATAIHDDLWAIACVIEDGYTRLGIVGLDAIGFFHDDVIAVRQRLPQRLRLSYTVICSTHNHSTPDLMGLWGPNHLTTGVDPAYRELVISATVRALTSAIDALAPAKVAFHEIATETEGLVTDTREPIVHDPDIRVMHFTHQVHGATIGTLVNWANHPETPWSGNTEITADFPGYLRDALEHGITRDGELVQPGLGGTHLFINGAIGGLITTSPNVTVRDPYSGAEFKRPSHEKGAALGHQLAWRIYTRLSTSKAPAADFAPMAVQARTMQVPMQNKLFLLAPLAGVIDRGHGWQSWNKLRTEVALITIGEASIVCLPGEVYPELVNGGIERAPGADFDIDPIEVPPIRELMPGEIKFVFGLANDEIGYIIPKSQWDQKAPYLYGAEKPVYGEINSPGPDAAFAIHQAVQKLAAAIRP
jgi:hypothetical protein